MLRSQFQASLLSTLASILRSSASSLDPTASVIIIIVIGVLFTAVEGKQEEKMLCDPAAMFIFNEV